MSTWYFVRHGQSIANRDGWLAGHVDAPLSPLGVRQAQRLAPQIRELPISRVLTSDLKRAYRTAELLTHGMNLVPERYTAVRERHLGDWEHIAKDWALHPTRKHHLMSWDVGPPGGGEGRRDVATRILRWLAEIDAGPNTLMVAHGTLLGAIIGLLDQTPVDRIGWSFMPNATLFKRQIAPNQWNTLLASIS